MKIVTETWQEEESRLKEFFLFFEIIKIRGRRSRFALTEVRKYFGILSDSSLEFVIGHFTVVCSVTWPLNGSEAGVDLALIQTSLLSHVNPN